MISNITNRNANLEIANELKQAGMSVCLPQDFCPLEISHEKYDIQVYKHCVQEMTESDVGLVNLDSFREDCSWECGWYVGTRKPLIGICRASTVFLNDFMIKGGLLAIATTEQSIHEQLASELSGTQIKYAKLDSLAELAEFINNAVETKKARSKPSCE